MTTDNKDASAFFQDERGNLIIDRERMKRFTLLDDIFMRAVLRDNRRGVQDIVRTLMDRDDIEVVEFQTQREYVNPLGRGVCLDVFAKDSDNRHYNIEIQRDNRGATPKRVRFNLSAVDWHALKQSEKFEDLPETWFFLITEKGYLCKGRPFRNVARFFTDDGELFDDGLHIQYVNVQYDGDDPRGWLMADLRTPDPEEMHFESLAVPAAYCKKNPGEKPMSDVMEEIRQAMRALLIDEVRDEVKNEVRDEVKNEVRDEVKNEVRDEVKNEVRKEVQDESRAEGRVQMIGGLLASFPAESLLNSPQFQPLGITQAEINAAVALGR